MPPRFYIQADLTEGISIPLPDSTAHHLQHVLRLKAGETITLFNGLGGEYQCQIASISKKSVSVVTLAFEPENRSSNLKVHAGLCVLKRDAMDRAIARAVELGVHQITPLLSDNGTVASKVIRKRGEHWQQVIHAACEQSGLNLPPLISPPEALPDWLVNRGENMKLMSAIGATALDTSGSAPASIALLIGPEGGLTSAEVQMAISAGFIPTGFGNRILRAETAPLVALSVLQRAWGDYRD